MGNTGTTKREGIFAIIKSFWTNEVENEPNIENINEGVRTNNVSEAEIKELKKSLKERLKVLEDNYGITPKEIKERKRTAPKIQKATINESGTTKEYNIEEANINNEDKIQEK